MLKIKFRNAEIVTPDHDDLLRSEVNQVLKNMEAIFNTSEHSLKRTPPYNVCYSITRLNKTDKLIVAYVPEASNNPYLFLLDRNTRELTETIPYEILRCLKSEVISAELKANVKDIDNMRFKRLQTDELTGQVIRKAGLRR